MNAKENMISESAPRQTMPDVAEASGTPNAIGAAAVEHRRPGPVMDPVARYGRDVDWVRPTDLMARGGSRVAGAGIDFQAELARRARHLTAKRAHGLADRSSRLPPLSAFGRGDAPRSMDRTAVGMS